MQEILKNKKGDKIILLGNDAIVRGALESGVEFVSTYPGTPASDIGNTFYEISNEAKVYFEFSTNEKVAMEAGIGASMSGLKTLIAMKNFGVNLASEALLPFCYTGSNGPLVLMVADDPGCWSSAQSEENSRGFAFLAHIPVLEPADPQECKDFTKLAFEISEKFKTPVMIRTTTRVSHQKSIVEIGEYIKNKKFAKGKFIKDDHKWITMTPRVLEMHQEVLDKLKEIKNYLNTLKINRIYGKKGSLGIITSGISFLHIKEALKEFKLDLPILKIDSFYPFPDQKVKEFIKNLKKVLIIEELDPYIEREIMILAKDINSKLKVSGKDLLSEVGEMSPELVIFALAKFTGKKYSLKAKEEKLEAKRYPQFCPGCPYWLTLSALKKAVDVKKVIWGGDIGCYMLAGLPPHSLQDYLYCMGSGIGIGHGIKKATGQKLIAFIGDSTFYHSGIPALVNTVFNKSNPLIIIFNNETTAMTGHQPHPAARGVEPKVNIEDIVKGCGVKNLKIIDPVNQDEFIKTVREFLEKDEVSVIISRRPCVFVGKKSQN